MSDDDTDKAEAPWGAECHRDAQLVAESVYALAREVRELKNLARLQLGLRVMPEVFDRVLGGALKGVTPSDAQGKEKKRRG